MKCNYYGCLAACLFICYALNGQYYFSSSHGLEPDPAWEAGISAGALNCLTDIGGNNGPGKRFIKDINWNQTQPCAGLLVSATWQSLIALRLNATVGVLKGNDNVLQSSTDEASSRYLRNLHFRTTVIELALAAELHLFTLIYPSGQSPLFSPYISAGFGFFHYNPQAFLQNRWIDLRPMHTEGQGFAEYPDRRVYSNLSWCFPAGAGIKYDGSGLFKWRFELVYRFTGTDYLDDVSQRYIDASLFSKYMPSSTAAVAAALADRSAELAGGMKNGANAIRGNPTNKDAWFSCMFTVSIPLDRLRK